MRPMLRAARVWEHDVLQGRARSSQALHTHTIPVNRTGGVPVVHIMSGGDPSGT